MNAIDNLAYFGLVAFVAALVFLVAWMNEQNNARSLRAEVERLRRIGAELGLVPQMGRSQDLLALVEANKPVGLSTEAVLEAMLETVRAKSRSRRRSSAGRPP